MMRRLAPKIFKSRYYVGGSSALRLENIDAILLFVRIKEHLILLNTEA